MTFSVLCRPPSVVHYSRMLATTPAPTVRPPSRMAKRSFSSMEVTLIVPIAMEEKLRFAIREGGRTVGAGVVASILE